jgi:hypothetical protein
MARKSGGSLVSNDFHEIFWSYIYIHIYTTGIHVTLCRIAAQCNGSFST